MFEDFLDDPAVYRECQNYWARLVERIAGSLGQVGDWQAWISPYYADGKTPTELEDNPICDRRSKKLDRAFRILQHRSTEEGNRLVAWLTYEQEYREFPSEELVISLVFSDASVTSAETLLLKWMNPTTTGKEMEGFIRASGVGG